MRKLSKQQKRFFTKEDIQISNKFIKKYSIILLSEKMQVKTIIYSYILTRISKLKIKQKKIVGENVEQSELILISF